MPTEQPLGPLIRQLRVSAGLTQRDAAQLAGLSIGALRDLEQGRTGAPRAASLRALAEALGADPALLLASRSAGGAGRGRPDQVTLGILGPLELRVADAVRPVRGRHVRTVVGLLALNPNEYVHYDQLADAIWDGAPPPANWRALLHTYVARSRRLLQFGGASGAPVIESAPDRYRLQIAVDALDSTAFVAGVEQAMTTSGRAEASNLFTEAFGRWRGPVLSDVAELSQHPRATRLGEVRSTSALSFAEAALAAGEPERALPILTVLGEADPLNEGLVAKQLRLLAGAGRLAEAGALYRATRSALSSELGVEPSAYLQLTFVDLLNDRADADGGAADPDLQSPVTGSSAPAARPGERVATAASSEDGPPPAAAWPGRRVSQQPRQLPRDLPDFVGREPELSGLVAYLAAERPDQAAPAVAAVLGMGGLGKTTLAIRTAHLVAAHFPSGQLYADLQVDGQPADPVRVLEQFLQASGHGERLPSEPDQLAALYRSVLATGRYLVVLDNVRSADQVAALLPGASGSAVLMTSRNLLVDLDGLHRVNLGPLSEQESMRMLVSMSDQHSLGRGLDDAREVSRLCAGLPLALRLAAARRITDPASDLHQIAEQLASPGAGLSALRSPGRAIRRSLESSYQDLPPILAEALPVLTLIPGSDFGVTVAASALALPPEQARIVLEDLCDSSLLLPAGTSRFRLHDVVREFALELADRAPLETRLEVHRRVCRTYLDLTATATQLNFPHRVQPDEPLSTARSTDAFGDAGAAAGWLERERANLVATVLRAAELGLSEHAWRLADALTGAFRLQPRAQDWLAVSRAGLNAATRLQQWQGIALMHESLARAHAARADHFSAVEHYRAGLEAAGNARWPEASVSLWENMAISLLLQGDLAATGQALGLAIDLSRQTGQRFFEAASLNDLGNLRLTQGRCREAIDYYRVAQRLNEELGDIDGQCVNQSNAVEAHVKLGELIQARQGAEELLRMPVQLSNPQLYASNLMNLSEIHRRLGNVFNASSLAEQAMEIVASSENEITQAHAMVVDGQAKAAIGLRDAGECRIEQGLLGARQAGAPTVVVSALLALAEVIGTSNSTRARKLVAEALALADDLGDQLSIAQACLLDAALAAEQGQSELASALAGRALGFFTVLGHRLGQRAATEFLSGPLSERGLVDA